MISLKGKAKMIVSAVNISCDGVQPVFVDGPIESQRLHGKWLAALGLEPGFPLELQLNPASRPRVPPRSFDEKPQPLSKCSLPRPSM